MHAGIQTGPDGATHEMLEDIGLMRMLPHMTVMVPADAEEGKKCTMAAAKLPNPCYLRFGRANEPVFTTPETPFEVGKALMLWDGTAPKVAFFTTGSVAYRTLQAAKLLEEEGIESIVVHFHTVKPFDDAAALAAALRVERIVTVEEHQVMGGFGSAVAEYLSGAHPIQITRMGIQDQFGQSGEADELMDYYGLSPKNIAAVGRGA
jgi:transketolase